MGTFTLRKGRNIRIKGAARKEIVQLPLPKQIGIQPSDFKGLKLRPVVKIGDRVKVGARFSKIRFVRESVLLPPQAGLSRRSTGEKNGRFFLSLSRRTENRSKRLSKRSPAFPAISPEKMLSGFSCMEISGR